MRKRFDKRWNDLAEMHGFTDKHIRNIRKKVRRAIKKSERRILDKITFDPFGPFNDQ